MLITAIRADGTRYYFDANSDWREPKISNPNPFPLIRVDDERYKRGQSGRDPFPSPTGLLVKMRRVTIDGPSGMAFWVSARQIRGEYDQVFPEVQAYCQERDAARRRFSEQAEAAMNNAGDLLMQLADEIGDSAVLDWRVAVGTRGRYVVEQNGLAAILGHIRRQSEQIAQLEDTCGERYRALLAQYEAVTGRDAQ